MEKLPSRELVGKLLFAQIKPGQLNSLLWLQNQLYSTPVNSDKLHWKLANKFNYIFFSLTKEKKGDEERVLYFDIKSSWLFYDTHVLKMISLQT